MRLIYFAILILGLCSCEARREETPEFFSRYSGIEICPAAQIRNVNEMTKSGYSGWDTVYEVDIVMDETCEKAFRQNLYERSNNKPQCAFDLECTFTADPDISYFVSKADGRVRFVFAD